MERSPVVSEPPDAQRWSGTLDIQGIQQLDMILDLGGTPTIDCMWTSRSRYRRSLGTCLRVSEGRLIAATLHTGLPPR